jgi:hypothetical protein
MLPSGLVDAWVALFSNHPLLRSIVGFLHVGGLLGGGGCAIAADLWTMRLTRGTVEPAVRAAHFDVLHSVHRAVVIGLAAVTVSGLLLVLADVDTFLYSKVFWCKMALVVALCGNGALLVRSEDRAQNGAADALRRLRSSSAMSLALWFVTTFLGTVLPNMG